MELNSTTIKGRANVAKLTLGGLAAVGIYFKMRGGSKVRAEVGPMMVEYCIQWTHPQSVVFVRIVLRLSYLRKLCPNT